ncbi:MAG: dihydropteroate synthase [Bacteroidota bacterium]
MKNFSTSGPLFSRNLSLNLHGRIMDLSVPQVMGIINTTPDSFYEGSRLPEPGQAVETARQMIEQGAAILDVGAVSSRPGAEEVPEEEELNRLSPVLEALRNEFPDFPISIDTWRSGVARIAHQRFRVDMINDISAGQLDPLMFRTISELQLPYVMMHMQGTPDSMQDSSEYDNVSDELLQFFGERVYQLRKHGVNDIIIDPGFGFGKTMEQNYKLLLDLDAFQMIELPIMVGISRKSMIYRTLELEPNEALNGTTAAHMAALLKGASLLRVHDVRAAVETVKIFQQIVESRTHKV